jgi:hypothetical protein
MGELKPGVNDANACKECGGTGETVDWSSVGCSDPSCCSPAMEWCRHCNETGIEPEPPQ